MRLNLRFDQKIDPRPIKTGNFVQCSCHRRISGHEFEKNRNGFWILLVERFHVEGRFLTFFVACLIHPIAKKAPQPRCEPARFRSCGQQRNRFLKCFAFWFFITQKNQPTKTTTAPERCFFARRCAPNLPSRWTKRRKKSPPCEKFAFFVIN